MGSILGKGVNWAEGTYAHFQIIASRYINSRASLSSLTGDERKRKTRYYVFIALGVLLLIWTVRLSLPQHATVDVIPVGNKYLPISSGPSDKFVPAVPTEGVTVPGELNFSKTAVIIETRFRTNLIPLILHFGSVLGPSWPIVIYTSPESVGLFSASAALNRYLKTGTVELRLLPQSTLFTNSDSVNEFMTDKWLWEDLAPAEHILIFQSDSMLCANAARSVDDYFEYDLVGAPIAPHLGNGYNGGLSLRKRSSILKVLNKWNWIDTKDQGDKERYEDQWFSGRYVHCVSYVSFSLDGKGRVHWN
jgi:hypothetical protein